MRCFYLLAGGATLYADSDYPYFILPPARVVPANPVLIGEEAADDISAHWHLIAENDNGDYLCIDLHPARAGRCYDAFYETYGLVGQTPIIARSFTELLARLYANKGSYPYWLAKDFAALGDAYSTESPAQP